MLNRLLLLSLFIVLVIEPMQLIPLGILPGLSTKNLLIYLTIFLLGIRLALSPNRLRFSDVDIHISFLAFILYAFLSWSIKTAFDPTYASLRGFIQFKAQLVDYYLLVLVYRYGVDSLEDAEWMLRAVVMIVMILTLAVTVDYQLGLSLFSEHRGVRAEGFVEEANQYGALLVFFLPIAITTMIASGRRLRWFRWFLIVAAAFMLIATGSRGAWTGFVVGPLLAGWYLRRQVNFVYVIRVWSAGLLIATFLVAFAAVVLGSDWLLDRVVSLDTTDLSRTSSGRVDIWTAMLFAMLQWPLSFLVGYGWFTYNSFGIVNSSHSEYLGTVFELGAVGLSLLLILLAVLIARTRARLDRLPNRLRRIQIGYLFGLVSLLTSIAFVDIPTTWSFVWVTTGIMLAIQAYGSSPTAARKTVVDGAPQTPPESGPRSSATRPKGPAWVSNTTPS